MIFFIEFESFDDESSKLQEVQETVMLSEETTAIYLELKNNDVSRIVNSSTTIQEDIDETNVSKEKKVFAEEQCNDEIDCPDSESSKPLENVNDMVELNAPQSTSTPRVDARGSSDDYDAVTDNNNVLWPDINSDEERYPSNESICGVKEETNIPLEQRSPIVRRKNERRKKKPAMFRTSTHQNAYSDGEYEEEEEDAEKFKRSHNQTSVRTDRRKHGGQKVLEVHDDSYIHPVKKRSIRYSRKKLDPNYDGTIGVRGMHVQDVLSDGEYDETSSVDLRYPPSTSDKMKKYRNYHEIQKSGTSPLQTVDLEHKQKSPGAQFIKDDQYTPSKQIHKLSPHTLKYTSNKGEDKSDEEYKHDAVLYDRRVETSFYDDKQHVSYQQTPNRKVSEHKKEWKETPHNQDLKGHYPPANESFGNKKNPSFTSTMSRHPEGAMPFQYVHDTSYDHSSFRGLTQYKRDQSRQSVPMDYKAISSHHYKNTKKHRANRRHYDDEDFYTDEDYEYPYMQRNHEPQDVQQNRRYKPHPYSKPIDEDEGNNHHYHVQERFDSPAASSRRVPNRLLEQRGDYNRRKINHVQSPNYEDSEDGQFWHSDAAYSEVTHPYSHNISNHNRSKYTERSYNSHSDVHQVNQRQWVHISDSPERLPKQKPDCDRVNSYPAMQQRNRRLPHTMSENDIDHIGKH